MDIHIYANDTCNTWTKNFYSILSWVHLVMKTQTWKPSSVQIWSLNNGLIYNTSFKDDFRWFSIELK